MRISGVDSTDLFGGTAAQPRQIIRVRLVNAGPGLVTDARTRVTVQVSGRGVGTPEAAVVTGLAPGAEVTAEVAIELSAPVAPGTVLPVLATASGPDGRAELAADPDLLSP